MGIKRSAFECIVACSAMLRPRAETAPSHARSIFVLRNNDLGDVLVITPLFEALKRLYPGVRIVAGVGTWAAPLLEGNPHVDEIRIVNAPWYNSVVRTQGLAPALRFLRSFSEPEAHDIGIDILGSQFGSLLLLKAGIPFRLGVRGYAGGHTAAQRCVTFNPHEHVGRSALRFAELLGATDLPENRPQLYLNVPPPSGALVFAPGGGYAEKCWPLGHFATLAGMLRDRAIHVIGGPKDREAGAALAAVGSHVSDCTGRSLRESFALIAAASGVVCNSSMAMHAAAAFRKPALVALGRGLPDAAQHAAQWGYPETRVLAMPSPDQAFAEIDRMLCAAESLRDVRGAAHSAQ